MVVSSTPSLSRRPLGVPVKLLEHLLRPFRQSTKDQPFLAKRLFEVSGGFIRCRSLSFPERGSCKAKASASERFPPVRLKPYLSRRSASAYICALSSARLALSCSLSNCSRAHSNSLAAASIARLGSLRHRSGAILAARLASETGVRASSSSLQASTTLFALLIPP